jgi:peptidoglycan/xylan/chitin deacetylase (PgdA/CDA1 family)
MTRVTDSPVDVVLSVDVEFSLNSALAQPEQPPLGAEWVYGEAGGRAEGLGFMLDCFDRHGLKGTFFTEVFNTYFFGDGPMRRVAADILARGHDLQLHLHPVWRGFLNPRWQSEPMPPPPGADSLVGRPPAEIAALLREGAAILERLSGQRPTAFRCGNLDAGAALYQGMAEAGLVLASNVGVGLLRPAEPQLQLYAGLHLIGDVLEVPVTTYRMPLFRNRLLLLTTAGSSTAEIRAVLTRAARQGVGPVVVLMHPHDFRLALSQAPSGPPRYAADRVRQRRLEQLCGHLATHPRQYRVTTFAEAATRWRSAAASQRAEPPLCGSIAGLAQRLLENKLRPALLGLPQ